MHKYLLYGIPVESELSLPNVPVSLTPQPTDDCITIRIGTVPENLVDSTVISILYQVSQRAYLLQIPGLARYLVSDGKRIVVQPVDGADENSIRLFLQGAVMGALLHQRRTFSIHGSCVVTSGGAVVFAGNSGTGKSTIAAVFNRFGYPVLADEISAIHVGTDGVARVIPGPREIKMWRSALEAIDYPNIDTLTRVRPQIDKFSVPMNADVQAAPLRMIAILNPVNRDDLRLVPLELIHKLPNLTNIVYQRRLALEMGAMPAYWETASAIAFQTQLAYLNRPIRGFDLESLIGMVEAAVSA
jgi:hypothetical protein